MLAVAADPGAGEQSRALIRRDGAGLEVVVELEEHQVAPRVAGLALVLLEDPVGLEAVEIHGLAAELEELRGRLGVEDGAREFDLRLPGEGRIAELGDDHRQVRGQAVLALLSDDVGEQRRVRRDRAGGVGAHVVEGIPLEREEVEVLQAPGGLEGVDESPGPRPVAGLVGPMHPVGQHGLISGAAHLDVVVDGFQRVGDLTIERGIVLGLGELPVGLLAHLDLLHRIPLTAQVAQQVARVLRHPVEDRHGHHERFAVRQAALEDPLEARVLLPPVEVARAVPRVGGGGPRAGLGVVTRVLHGVGEGGAAGAAQLQLADREAEPVAHVGAAGGGRAGAAGHRDPHVVDPHRRRREARGLGAAGAGEGRGGEVAPAAVGADGEDGAVVALPVLHRDGLGEGRAPVDLEGVDVGALVEADHHPLRVVGVVALREVRVEVGVGLPEARVVAVREAAVAVVAGLVDGVAAPRQAVAVGDARVGAGRRVAGPVALLRAGVAPRAFGVPMPRLDAQFRAQPEAQGAEAGGLHEVDGLGGPHPVDLALFEAVDAGAERVDAGEGRLRLVRVHRDGRVRGAVRWRLGAEERVGDAASGGGRDDRRGHADRQGAPAGCAAAARRCGRR